MREREPEPGSWRALARPIIRGVMDEARGMDIRVLRRLLRDAYPFGERRMLPYKVWCDEVQRALGTKPIGAASAREHAATPDMFA